MQKTHFLLLKKFKNTDSAQLCDHRAVEYKKTVDTALNFHR